MGDEVTERHGEAFEFDEQLTVVGPKLAAGDAPRTLRSTLDPDGAAMQSVPLADTAGTVRLLNMVNSLDTPVCHVETRRWEGLRGDLPDVVRVYTISMDLPFAQARWQRGRGCRAPGALRAQDERSGATTACC